MARTTRAGIVVLALLIAAPASHAQFNLQKQKAKGKVSLVSSVDAVVPGKPFDVALYFQLTPGWHIYWKNAGESGLPPNVMWSLPEGFEPGELQYPVPKRHRNAAGITTNILDGNPVLLARITPPDVITADRVALRADVQYLICATACLRENAPGLLLDLPVRSKDAVPNLINIPLFEVTRDMLPKDHGEHVTITAATEPKELPAAGTFELSVSLSIEEGYFVQAHEPPDTTLVNCDVFLERSEGVFFRDPIFPSPQTRSLGGSSELSEYTGRVDLRVPGELDPVEARGPVRLAGIVKYQVRDASGMLMAPEALTFSLMARGDGVAAAGTAPGSDTSVAPGGLSGFLGRFGFAGLMIGCFLYGLFINATPCVLPLLSIKVLGFVQQAHESRRRTLLLGLAFGAGVMLFFVILGFLASAGKNVLQYPAVVIGLGTVVMALALSMLGVYTLQAPAAATSLESNMPQEGLAASFGKGALAPVLGFACTGPLLAGAFGWATQQPPHIAVLAFLFAGLGMASPYMLLGANPNWLSFLPKPGPWMITFERVMGFLLLAMVIWLLGPLVAQIGPEGLQWTLGFLVAVAMGCWLLGKIGVTMTATARWRYRGGAAALMIGSGLFVYGWAYPLDEARVRQQLLQQAGTVNPGDWSSGIPWQRWSSEAVEREVRSGKTVFVDFTAAWCTVCKANKAVAIDTKEVHEKMRALDVVPFRGDFTSEDAEIAAAMRKHGRAGPPLNLIYPAGLPDDPIVLRPNLTKSYLLEKLDEAGRSRVASVSRISP
jgi:thiol:disulfide interchange protein DsbD